MPSIKRIMPTIVSRSSTRHRRQDEIGATLLLALMFMVSGSLLIAGLMAWSGNDLRNVAAFKQSRTLNYAANSAIETAIANVRYTTNACPPAGLSISVPGPSTDPSQTLTIQVWCSPASPQSEQPYAASRDITFAACLNSSVIAGTCTQANPYLRAEVIYDDYVKGDIANGTPCTNHCGENETIKSWVFQKNQF
jgi:hypothetical protein